MSMWYDFFIESCGPNHKLRKNFIMFAEVFQIRYEKTSEKRIIFKINRMNKFIVF